MTNRTQALLLSLTALVVGIVMFIMNDVSSGSPISDGGSHYVTGLLAYDWLHQGKLSNPVHFGTEYFRQLPYIGLLLWPPLFYGVEMLAFLIFGPSINVALALCAAIFGVGAVVLGQAAWKSGRGALVAHAMVLALLTSTLIQDVQRNVLIDGLVAVLSLAAIFQFTYFLIHPSWRGAVLTGLLTILAFYAKGNAMQLGLAFPIAALLLHRLRMLIDRRTLAMGIACILITGPWLYLTAGLSAQGFLYSRTLEASLELTLAHFRNIFLAIPLLVPFALLGAVTTVSKAIRSTQQPEPRAVFDTACLSIIVACVLFHVLIPAGADPRYMLTAVFASVGLAASGLETLINWVGTRMGKHSSVGQKAPLIVAGVLALQAVLGFVTPLEPIPRGARTVAAEVMKVLPPSNRSVLISGDFNAETSVGPALAELAGAGRAGRDGIIVVRGSRALAGGAYRNRDYEAKFQSDAAYHEELRRLGVPVIVTSTPRSNEQWEHVAAIERVLGANNSEYTRVAVLPFHGAQQLSIWRLNDALVKPVDFDLVSESNTFRQRVSSVVR